MADTPPHELEYHMPPSEKDAAERFKVDGGKAKKRKKLTLKRVVDASGFDKLPPTEATWSNIESRPTFLPVKKYSDLSGFEAPYTDPKTKLRYSSAQEYQQILEMPQELVQARLVLRGLNVAIR
mmetsp:Transcript_13773/g.34689  ORF Transcript_13773/g.34689 Transcript_13773/m.34689 type:complete len:124 (+) Transcript_13773:26-397(+)|eukprot:CAMPEP_0198242066 /NCGR_PEP_ID=MMETSP1446-20131203/9868_1 /TAXON_ID=1461542 ORGANISM="Unidentified sp, Strain CCMP2111" /NCGR_SAMPLE_ID=MMETSP1446 /ASSEMBLY_ACC=CAM_ASM_001112 /LENGTH=123 /DNA_ID=CAMNT_0043925253 /DNA_START=184 /DNA_END=555 /DNA_ORIENTATION=+